MVSQQDEKIQHKNKAKAMKVLRARLYERERQRPATPSAPPTARARSAAGDRSERIRTYNFPQGRVTDHRINLTLYKLDEIMEGRGAGRADRRADRRGRGGAAGGAGGLVGSAGPRPTTPCCAMPPSL